MGIEHTWYEIVTADAISIAILMDESWSSGLKAARRLWRPNRGTRTAMDKNKRPFKVCKFTF